MVKIEFNLISCIDFIEFICSGKSIFLYKEYQRYFYDNTGDDLNETPMIYQTWQLVTINNYAKFLKKNFNVSMFKGDYYIRTSIQNLEDLVKFNLKLSEESIKTIFYGN